MNEVKMFPRKSFLAEERSISVREELTFLLPILKFIVHELL